MVTLIVRRVVSLIPTLLAISIAVFALSLGIGSERAAQTRAGGLDAPTAQAVENAKKLLKLDEPVTTRYVDWLSRAVQGDFGRSFVRLESVGKGTTPKLEGAPVGETIATVFPRTLSLALVALFFAIVIGVTVGIIGGVRPGSLVDRLTMVFSTVGLAMPSFWVGMLLVSWISVKQQWLPAVGYEQISDAGVWGWLQHLIIPGFAMALGPAAVIARQMRSALSEVMGSPYIRTAWAKGASLPRVVGRHALRNAASAPLTILGLVMVHMMSGAIIVETLFGINGMGQLIVGSVRANDVPMLQGVVMMFVLFAVTVNLLIDIAYGILNPKVRLS